ncbi:hypothetical protein [Rhizobium leguminosarum]
MFKRSLTALAFLFVLILTCFIAGSTEAADSQKVRELNRRFAYWNSASVAPYCTFDGGRKFPSKYHKSDNRDNETGKCDDGDSIMFNALLCSVGEQDGCDAVKRSKTNDGRWWRSPKKARETATEGGSETTFSNDHAVGVMLYALETNNGDELEEWIRYLNKGRLQNIHPAYCKDTRCAFKLFDCPLLDRAAAILARPNFLCGPPYRPSQALAELRRAHEAIEEKYNELPAKEALAPGFKQANELVKKLLDQLSNLSSAIETEAERAATLARAAANLDGTVALLNAHVNDAGFARNNVSVAVYMLMKYGAADGPELRLAASQVAAKEPRNAFLEYVAHGATDKMLDIILEKCRSEADDRKKPQQPRHQWTWERTDQEIAHRETMFWDCVFVAKLYKAGDIRAQYNGLPGVSNAAGELSNQQEKLVARIEEVFDLLNGLVNGDAATDPAKYFGKFAEREFKRKVAEIETKAKKIGKEVATQAKLIERTIRNPRVEDILNPGFNPFPTNPGGPFPRIPIPGQGRILPW